MCYPAKYKAIANEMTEVTNILIAIRLLDLDISGLRKIVNSFQENAIKIRSTTI
ncbi:MAG TPA: hypothetical protein VLQ66_04405 [Paenisporosarcina sp.]|nr:hypothetical protein [Paenisporosarcina sp.]